MNASSVEIFNRSRIRPIRAYTSRNGKPIGAKVYSQTLRTGLSAVTFKWTLRVSRNQKTLTVFYLGEFALPLFVMQTFIDANSVEYAVNSIRQKCANFCCPFN